MHAKLHTTVEKIQRKFSKPPTAFFSINLLRYLLNKLVTWFLHLNDAYKGFNNIPLRGKCLSILLTLDANVSHELQSLNLRWFRDSVTEIESRPNLEQEMVHLRCWIYFRWTYSKAWVIITNAFSSTISGNPGVRVKRAWRTASRMVSASFLWFHFQDLVQKKNLWKEWKYINKRMSTK